MFVFKDSFPPVVPLLLLLLLLLLLNVYDFLLLLEEVDTKRLLAKWLRSMPPGELPMLSESSISTTSMLFLSLLWAPIDIPFRLELPLSIELTVLGLATPPPLLLPLLDLLLLEPSLDMELERKLTYG
jgi:hypothetical protein